MEKFSTSNQRISDKRHRQRSCPFRKDVDYDGLSCDSENIFKKRSGSFTEPLSGFCLPPQQPDPMRRLCPLLTFFFEGGAKKTFRGGKGTHAQKIRLRRYMRGSVVRLVIYVISAPPVSFRISHYQPQPQPGFPHCCLFLWSRISSTPPPLSCTLSSQDLEDCANFTL